MATEDFSAQVPYSLIKGPGYRIYYAMIGKVCALLLCGGDKRKQSADVGRAIEYFNDYKERTRPL